MSKWNQWYQKIFVGNPNKADFTVKDLPKTRREQFFDVIKLRFTGMVTGNLLYTLFALPLLFWTLYFWFAVSQIQGQENIAEVLQGNLLISFLTFCVPLYAIMGPAKAGLHYCLRNWAWNERATVKEHFWKEFKRSFWKALFLNLFTAMVLFAGIWWISVCLLNAETYPALKFVAALIAVVMGLYFISSIYHFPQLVTYNLKVRQILKNGFIYTFVQLPRTLLAVLAYLALALACFFLWQVLLVVFLTMGMSFVFLAQTVYSQFLFDKYVNDPSKQRRGMAPQEQDAVR
ncbi:MAG: DUF624 domain-containing protein [Clostridia bacterium]|nr:DUF624 domain-containing protein [Clostridia bacterium]